MVAPGCADGPFRKHRAASKVFLCQRKERDVPQHKKKGSNSIALKANMFL